MDIRKINRIVLEWYAINARELPWRSRPYLGDAYAVLVSEIMLQQTQVNRAIPKFLEFMMQFPSIHALASASPGDVINLWSGMGFNNRAVRLHRLARIVVADYAGVIPREIETLLTLPGVGRYTAAAVACFAYEEQVPVFDTNIYRVLSRLVHGIDAPSRAEIEPLGTQFLPDKSASLWNQALMDIGATLCTALSPRCMRCPLHENCTAAPFLQGGGDPAIAKSSVPNAPRQAKFAGSTRYYRGRIVETLRQAPSEGLAYMNIDILFKHALGTDLELIIDGLVRDGLVVRASGMLHLP